jgi:hypothetical protein
MAANARNGERADPNVAHPRGILMLLTDESIDPGLVEELRDRLPREPIRIMVIAPAVEKSPLHHALGDVDTATREAEKRLGGWLAELHRHGISALGQVGDSDPVVAAADALRQYPAEEVLIVAHTEDQRRWFEDGLFERAQEELYPAVRMVTIRHEDNGHAHLTGTRISGPGRKRPEGADRELELSPNLPSIARGDLVGIVIAVVGTIAAIVLAATGPDSNSAAGAAQILIAMAVSLINMAHVVGLTLLESVGHRGGWQRFFRDLSMVATPSAVVANLLLTLFG